MNALALQQSSTDAESALGHKVLVAVAQELQDLSDKNNALQSMITPLLKSELLNATHMIEVQSADMLTQHLAELAKFLSNYVRLSAAGETDSVSSALNTVVLSALAERLSAICLGLEAAKKTQDPVEFF